MIRFNQIEWLNLYIDMNTKLRTKKRNDSYIELFKLMNDSGFWKTTENFRKNKIIRLATTDKKQLFSVRTKLSHNKIFSKIILETEMNKTKVKLNKTIYFGLSILEICKAAIHGFWYDSIKPKY